MGIPVFSPCLVHKELPIILPDQLLPKLLKWLVTFLTEPLADLFNNCLATGVVPSEWKVAVICPIFKKGGGPTDVIVPHMAVGGT